MDYSRTGIKEEYLRIVIKEPLLAIKLSRLIAKLILIPLEIDMVILASATRYACSFNWEFL
jgi:hypothetical protein